MASAGATNLALVDTVPLSVQPAWGRSCLGGASIAHFAATKPKDVSELTPRQLEILELLGEGKAVKKIGKELYLS